jgi:hypothetical protein
MRIFILLLITSLVAALPATASAQTVPDGGSDGLITKLLFAVLVIAIFSGAWNLTRRRRG